MQGSNQANLGTDVSQLPSTVECNNCGTEIRESTAFGDLKQPICRDCYTAEEGEIDLMLDLVEEEDR